MEILAQEWVIGYSVIGSLSVILYLVFSIRLIVSCRRTNYDVGVSAFIPFINLFIWGKKCRINRYKKSGVVISENEEFEL